MGRNKRITAMRRAKRAAAAQKEHERRTNVQSFDDCKTVRNHRKGNGARARSRTKNKYGESAHKFGHTNAAEPHNGRRKWFDVEIIDGLPVYHGYNYQ